MSDPSITYFPVDNGDMILIHLSDKTDIVIDCNITEAARDEDNDARYDIHNHLLRVLKKNEDGNPHIDAFILTHPDEDHCRQLKQTFYLGDPDNYDKSHKKSGLILIDELWFAPRIFNSQEELCDNAYALRKEAQRRIKLYRNNKSETAKPGNRLRVIGYSDTDDLGGLETIITTPGNSIDLINGSLTKGFSFYVHAPFRKDTDAEWIERNDTSIVLHARFDVDNVENAGLAFFGGDAGCAVWEDILDKSKDRDLEWDLFLAPHHCSWTFFSEQPYKDNKIPSEKALALLNKKRENAIIVASCKPIKQNDDNPPHYAAAEEYKKIVGEERFIALSNYPPNSDVRLPLIFAISASGPVEDEAPQSSAVTSSAAVRNITGTPQTYG